MAKNMFQFHNHNSRSEAYVTEYRAPTDESVRLLKEMESEAKQKIVESITVNNTTFECSVQMNVDPINDRSVYWIVYQLNGKQSKLEVAIPNWMGLSDIDKINHVRDGLAKDIASNMIGDLFRTERTRNLFMRGY
jgi:hypothetical protein